MSSTKKQVLMLAAENDMLPGAKVGGVGDVVRDLPQALCQLDWDASVILPSYGFLARLPNLSLVGGVEVLFSGFSHNIQVFKIENDFAGVNNFIVHCPEFSAHGETVYCNDPDWRPFASDATKFALYCLAVAAVLKEKLISTPDIVHLHDWHTAFFLILREYSQSYDFLKSIRCVYTIHNLALQGIRPFKNDESALETWYPDLSYDGKVIADKNNLHCLNPMRAAILLADKVNTVSPTYAKEIQLASHVEDGIYGGEGLEAELIQRHGAGELIGILNGCQYAKKSSFKKPAKTDVIDVAKGCLLEWAGKKRQMLSAHWIADQRLEELKRSRKSRFVLSSVGRITEQKARLLHATLENGKYVLHAILEALGERGIFIILGSGDPDLEDFITETAGKYDNIIFLNGYSDPLSKLIYRYGDLFLMPSSFEPCGISQMLAMRVGQPCLVNAVGGLKDTVIHKETGFVFEGKNIQSQAKSLITTLDEALNCYFEKPDSWSGIRHRASQQRFTWQVAAKTYLTTLYH